MLEAVLFDLDGTLTDFVDADIKSLQWLHASTRASIGFEDFLETAIDEVMKFHELVAENKTDPLTMHRFRLENTFIRCNLAWNQDYVYLYQKKLLEFSLPFSGVENLLRKIRHRVKTGLITNAYDGFEQRERIRNAGLESYFDVIVIAGEIGIYKPAPDIFLSALRCLEVVPEKAIYVGDSIKHDVLGAKAAGMKTVLFSQKLNRKSNEADFHVCGTAELMTLLDQIVP